MGPAGRAGAITAAGVVVREWDEVSAASRARGVLARVAAGVGPASVLIMLALLLEYFTLLTVSTVLHEPQQPELVSQERDAGHVPSEEAAT